MDLVHLYLFCRATWEEQGVQVSKLCNPPGECDQQCRLVVVHIGLVVSVLQVHCNMILQPQPQPLEHHSLSHVCELFRQLLSIGEVNQPHLKVLDKKCNWKEVGVLVEGQMLFEVVALLVARMMLREVVQQEVQTLERVFVYDEID